MSPIRLILLLNIFCLMKVVMSFPVSNFFMKQIYGQDIQYNNIPIRQTLFPNTHIRHHNSSNSMNMRKMSQSHKNDWIQKLGCKIGSTTSMVVSLSFFSVLAYKRDAFMVTFFLGSILNGIMSKVLKTIINQERPVSTISTTSITSQQHAVYSSVIKPSDKGMPSR